MTRYIGRFAPSPSGPLHRGSVVAAMASYLDAKAHQGKWLLRLEDIDRERCDPAHSKRILTDLEKLGFEWNDSVWVQSERSEFYQEALTRLQGQGETYRCYCSRKEITDSATNQATEPPNSDFTVYPGTCRNLSVEPAGKQARAIRIALRPQTIAWDEGAWLPGTWPIGSQVPPQFNEQVSNTVGDFVLARPISSTGKIKSASPTPNSYDWTYQLAVVVDDALAGVTHIVRGQDLQGSTSRQIYLQQRLGLLTPQYWHCKLVLTDQGQKLSKQNGARGITSDAPMQVLNQALSDLELPPLGNEQLQTFSLHAFWAHATLLWQHKMLQPTS